MMEVPTIVKIHVCDNCLEGKYSPANPVYKWCAICMKRLNPAQPLDYIVKAVDEPIKKLSREVMRMKHVEGIIGDEGLRTLINARKMFEKKLLKHRHVIRERCCGDVEKEMEEKNVLQRRGAEEGRGR